MATPESFGPRNWARLLAVRLGLDGLVPYDGADALAVPFSEAVPDVVWTQHASMKIDDRARLYA